MGKARFWVAAVALLGTTQALAADSLANLKVSLGEWERYKLQSRTCRWGNPLSDALFAADAQMMRRLTALDDPRAKSLFVPQSPSASPCGGPEDKEAKLDGNIRSWLWLTRLKFYSEFGAQAGWMRGLVAVPAATVAKMEPRRQAVGRQLAAEIGQDKLDGQVARLREEAMTIHGLVCVSRRGPKGAGVCPKLSPSFQAEVPAGKIRAEEVEAAAKAVTGL